MYKMFLQLNQLVEFFAIFLNSRDLIKETVNLETKVVLVYVPHFKLVREREMKGEREREKR
jgi:hypothetical protein